MTRPDLQELLERVEGAEGGSHQWGVLRDVRLALVPFEGSGDAEDVRAWIARFNVLCDAGGYESAALVLVERVLPGFHVLVSSCGAPPSAKDSHSGWRASLKGDYDFLSGQPQVSLSTGVLKTPALALIAALLKALIKAKLSDTTP
jgi:hypothetical protein